MVNYSTGLTTTFAALSDSKRVAILERLTEGDASCSELAEPLGLSLPAFTKHLRVLEASGLVRSKKFGRVRICSLNPKPLADAEAWMDRRRRAWDRSLDRLGSHLQTKRRKK